MLCVSVMVFGEGIGLGDNTSGPVDEDEVSWAGGETERAREVARR